MKRILWVVSFIVLALSIQAANASCLFQEKDPVCSVAGETYTNSCQWWSDTSSWSMPVAYEGTCQETEELNEVEKEAIYNILNEFFKLKDYKWELYTSENVDDNSDTLNTDGQDFVRNKLFPAIKKYIVAELEKDTPNTRWIAILNYAASTVWYDYYFYSKKAFSPK